MSATPSRFGSLLYRMLPAAYREQDNAWRDSQLEQVRAGDLAQYLDALGVLLDEQYSTLEQRLADAFPDNPTEGRACQEWLIPYFARLLNVRLVAPDVAGQRDEVYHAVRWRQGLGTLFTAEEIAESVTRDEVELQEGWKRVALTPRVGQPLLPASFHGVTRAIDARRPREVARHPGLPAATVDLRCVSQAVRTQMAGPAVKQGRLGGVPTSWMQANPHGVPRAPGRFDDVSRRTVDMRTPDGARGHAHPRRLLLFTPTPHGLFPGPEVVVAAGAGGDLSGSRQLLWTVDERARELRISARTRFPVRIEGDLQLPPPGLEVDRVAIEGLCLAGALTVRRGALRLSRVVAGRVSVETAFFDRERPVLEATDAALGTLRVPAGYARLERATVRGEAICGAVVARDSLFAGALVDAAGEVPRDGEIRRCRVSQEVFEQAAADAAARAAGTLGSGSELAFEPASCTSAEPVFLATAAGPDPGVLSPDTPEAILLGAEDGGELGAWNRGRAGRPVRLVGPQALALTGEGDHPLRDLVLDGPLTVAPGARRPLLLERVGVGVLAVRSDARTGPDGRPEPVLQARHCVLEQLAATPGLARLEYCTVLGGAELGSIQASDCVFAGAVALGGPSGGPRPGDCLRYSRIPPALAERAHAAGVHLPFCTAAPPLFAEPRFARAASGAPGGAVLHPAAPAAVAFGAEDGGEMGAYHDRRHCLTRVAVIDKLVEHLPVGVEPVLVLDDRLEAAPSAARTEETHP